MQTQTIHVLGLYPKSSYKKQPNKFQTKWNFHFLPYCKTRAAGGKIFGLKTKHVFESKPDILGLGASNFKSVGSKQKTLWQTDKKNDKELVSSLQTQYNFSFLYLLRKWIRWGQLSTDRQHPWNFKYRLNSTCQKRSNNGVSLFPS